jgi:hypothetical protein
MNLNKNHAALGTGDSAEIATEPGNKTVVSTSGAAGTASANVAAITTGVHVCKAISVSIAAGAAAQGPITVVLRDGATGVGTIKWSKTLSAPANGSASVDPSGLSIVGTRGNQMTLEFTAGGAANTIQDVTLMYFDLLEGLPNV